MINNIQEPSISTPGYQEMVDKAVNEGMYAAVFLFARHNKIEATNEKLTLLASLLTAEVFKDRPYPFEESFIDALSAAIRELTLLMMRLYDRGEHENLIKVARLVGGEASSSFLEKHKAKAIELINSST